MPRWETPHINLSCDQGETKATAGREQISWRATGCTARLQSFAVLYFQWQCMLRFVFLLSSARPWNRVTSCLHKYRAPMGEHNCFVSLRWLSKGLHSVLHRRLRNPISFYELREKKKNTLARLLSFILASYSKRSSQAVSLQGTDVLWPKHKREGVSGSII